MVAEKKENEMKQTETKETGRVQPVQENKELKIYIGPTLRGMVSGTVFKGGFPPAFLEAAGKCPALKELAVPVNRLPQVNRELLDPDSAMSRFYRMAQEYRKGV